MWFMINWVVLSGASAAVHGFNTLPKAAEVPTFPRRTALGLCLSQHWQTSLPILLHLSTTYSTKLPIGWRMGHTNILVIPAYVSPYFTASDFPIWTSVCGNFAPKAIDSRDAEDAAAPGLHDDVYEAVLHSAPEDRIRLEKSLLRKLDTRMSILVLIYILNYVSISWTHLFMTFMWWKMA